MAALDATGGAITGTAIAVTAHESAIAAPVMGSNTTAADTESIPVGINFDRSKPFQQHLVDNKLETVDIKNVIALFGPFQGNTKGANTATAKFNKQADGSFFLILEMFPHQLHGPWGHFKHVDFGPIRFSLFPGWSCIHLCTPLFNRQAILEFPGSPCYRPVAKIFGISIFSTL